MRARDVIYELEPYEVENKEGLIYLASNESPFDLPSDVRDSILREVHSTAFNRYPDIMADEIRIQLASFLGVGEDEIVVGNGSDELLLYLTVAFAGCGRRVLYPSPSFSMYRYYTAVAGAEYIEVELNEDFSLPIERILNLLSREKVSMVFVAYPNNPTANLWNRDDLLRIISSTDAIVVVDEAYFDFSSSTLLPYLHDFPNLVISRTFSKAWGLAGLRCGYLVANRDIIDVMKRVKQPFNVNVLTQLAVKVCLQNRWYVEDAVKDILKERDRLMDMLSSIGGIAVYPSYTNFLVVKGEGVTAGDLYRMGIVVKEFFFRGERFLRVTVGKPEENDRFVLAIKELMSSESGTAEKDKRD